MKALILAAGYATRLYPLTKKYPKPLLKVAGRCLIDYIVSKVEAVPAIDEIVVVTNSRFIAKFRRWGKNIKTEKKVTIVDDLTSTLADRRGAIGDIQFVLQNRRINDDLLVIGGDNLFDGDLNSLLNFAKRHRKNSTIGVFDIKSRSEAVKYGVIKLDKRHKIIDFKEKPQRPFSTLVAMCLYYFPKEKLGLIGQYLGFKEHKQDATGFYIDWLRKKEPAYGYVFRGSWYDIGDMDFYRKAQDIFSKIKG